MANATMNPNDTTYTPAPSNARIDDKVVKKLVGEAVFQVDGVLDAKDGLTDMFKSDDDMTRGITVSISDEHSATICAKIVTETGKNIPDIVNNITKADTETLQANAGIAVKDLEVEVTDTMTKEEYKNQNNPDLAPMGVPPTTPMM